MDIVEPTAGALVVGANIYIEVPGALLIKSLDTIESEVNELMGYIWTQVEPIAREHNELNEAQHELCHMAGEMYSVFKECALNVYTISGNPAMWELVEQLTDKQLACNSHK